MQGARRQREADHDRDDGSTAASPAAPGTGHLAPCARGLLVLLAVCACQGQHQDLALAAVSPPTSAGDGVGRRLVHGCAALPDQAADAACAPWLCDRGRDLCVPVRCRPDRLDGACPAGLVCSVEGLCELAPCGPAAPGGSCPGGQVCTPQGCLPLSCDPANPHGACPGEMACSDGRCLPVPCVDSAGGGACPPGEACRRGDDGRPGCRPLVCSNDAPNGPCPDADLTGEACIDVGGPMVSDFRCLVPPCSTHHPGGTCPDPADACAGGHCLPAPCGPGQRQGACPRSQACVDGICQRRPCHEADSRDGGTCGPGEACCTDALRDAGFCAAPGSCVPRACSTHFPHGTCAAPGALCTPGPEGPRCRPMCGPDAPTGACPPGFACVERRCMVPCPFDQDCDTISDDDEGLAELVDTDGDGIPDAFDRDSDGDGIPDYVEAGDLLLSTPPASFVPGGVPNFRNLDSDGDLIADRIEAGPDPLHPVDTDGDGHPDYLDLDSDGDGILDRCEARDVPGRICGNQELISDPALLADSNGDGVPDYLSLDSDGDGIPDAIEARLVPHDPSTLDPRGVSHHPSGLPDYRNLDSDGDGLPDALEDVNGNGIVDCQVDGRGRPVRDPRPAPACGDTQPPFGAGRGEAYDFNPGCPAEKCLLAETSRIHPDSDGNGIGDAEEGAAKVCAPGRSPATNLFVSRQGDYVLALPPAFDRVGRLQHDGGELGLRIDATRGDSGAWPVSGLLLRRPATWSLPADGREAAATQARADLRRVQALADVAQVAIELEVAGESFDGFPEARARLLLVTHHSTTSGALRDRLATALGPELRLVPAAHGPAAQRFVVQLTTVLRREDDASTTWPMTLAAVVADVPGGDSPHSYGYRRRCRDFSDQQTCHARLGCGWSGADCVENGDDPPPWSFADNLVGGGALSQYGDSIADLCQPLTQGHPRVDFLWTIDNSGSMADKIGQVMRASALFFPFLDNSEADYRVGMTTTAANSPYWRPHFPGCHGLDRQACDNARRYANFHADGGCTWFEDACYPACAPWREQGQCARQPGCGLGDDGICRWLGCETIASRPRCEATGCAWRPGVGCGFVGTTDLINGRIAADFTGAIAGRRSVDAADRSIAYRCEEGCTVADASCAGRDPDDCRAHGACAWDASGGRCRTNCCPACLHAPDAAPSDPACYFAARLPNDTGSGDEFGLAMTQWAVYRAGVRPDCARLRQQAACVDHGGCLWDGQGCREAACANAAASERDCEGYLGSQPPAAGDPEVAAAAAAPYPGSCEFNRNEGACVASLPASPTPGEPLPVRCHAAPDVASCHALGPRCDFVGDRCVPTAAGNEVLCWAADPDSCRQQGEGFCAWDDCVGHREAAQCEAVAGCLWRPQGEGDPCQPRAHGGACRPPLARMMRANAKHVAVIISDEEECALKDGPDVWRGAIDPVDPVQCRHNLGAYDGSCCGDQYQGGLMLYDDPVRRARTHHYADFLAARGVTVFGLVGDAADPTRPPTVHRGEAEKNGGCLNQRLRLSAEAGQAYVDVARLTGGGWGSICADDLYPSIESVVLGGLFSASPYRLEGFIDGRRVQPIASTLTVAVERCQVPTADGHCPGATEVVAVPRSREDGFDYDPHQNALILFGRARPAAAGSIVVSYRYWVDRQQPASGSADLCPCPETVAPSCRCPAGMACGMAQDLDTCAGLAEASACVGQAGCRWNTSNGGFCAADGICAADPTCAGGCIRPGDRCDAASGLCICDRGCGGGCLPGQRCDDNVHVNACEGRSPSTCAAPCAWDNEAGVCVSPTCGQCICDTACGQGCPKGQRCDDDLDSVTCGRCRCDPGCAGGCGAGEVCDQDPGSPLCGLCLAAGCDDCAPGQSCSPEANVCVCDPTCGGLAAPPGQICDDDVASPSCGLFVCDPTCAGGCPAGQLCRRDPGDAACGLCRPDVTCGADQAPCGADCAAADQAACGAQPGCRWKPGPDLVPRCLPEVAMACDRSRGLCEVDPTCGAAGCSPFERCDPGRGACACDPTCGGRSCPVGQACDGDPRSPTCGQCACDTRCGGGCAPGQQCQSDPALAACGICAVDPTCGGGCQSPWACAPSLGLCVADPLCGGSCPVGSRCSAVTGLCTQTEANVGGPP